MELPQEFLARMEKMLGAECEEFFRAYERPRQFGLRVNTLKISVEEFVKLAPFHLRKIPWTDNGFYYEKEDDPARHPFYYAGLYYLQEPSAMLPAAVLPVVPGERVLDLCAAPGGKATALAAKLQGQGLLVANEISASRAKALLKNLEVSGVINSFVTNTTANRLAEQFPEAFDRILVDAPCSGEGMFRKDPANARAWSPEKVQSCAKIQREIARFAVDMLRPGGLLLYSTCTFAPEENEGTVADLLSHCPELELLEIPECGAFSRGDAEYLRMFEQTDAPDVLSRCVRLFPHRCEGEGHFLALFRRRKVEETAAGRACPGCDIRGNAAEPAATGRKGETAAVGTYPGCDIRGNAAESTAIGRKKESGKRRQNKHPGETESREEKAVLLEFLKDVYAQWDPRRIEVRSGQAYYVPEAVPGGRGLPFLRNGLYLGEIRRGRFEPSQSFAMALKAKEYASVVDFAQDDIRVRRYLHGETVQIGNLETKRAFGWQLVCVCGCPLGWGKLVNGTLKNKYHAGWRMQS